jgi:hypothetical protein
MKSKTNYNSLILEALGQKPIAFNPLLAQIGGSVAAGLLLSQLLYWHGKGYRGLLYKTIPQLRAETGLTRSEQNRGIKAWKNLGVLEVDLHGLPRKRYFSINASTLCKLLERATNTRGVVNSTGQCARFDTLDGWIEHAITESTSKKTYRDPSRQEGGRATAPKDYEEL